MSSVDARVLSACLLGLVQWVLVLGGVGLVVAAFFTGNLGLGIGGAVAVLLSGAVRAVDRRMFAKDLESWATDAVAGVGPVPPPALRMKFIQQARAEGMNAPMKQIYQALCRDWAARQ